MNLKYVLDHLIEHRRCNECEGFWFLFDYEGTESFYRLSEVAPEWCTICAPLDLEIESKSLVSIERWIKS